MQTVSFSQKSGVSPKRVFYRVVVCLMSAAVMVGFLSAGLLYLIRQDDNAERFAKETEVSFAFLAKAVMAAAGEEVEISAGELSSVLNLLLRTLPEKEEGEQALILRGIYLEKEERADTLFFYAPVSYKGRNLGVSGKAKLSFDAASEKIEMRLSDLKLGRLPLPTSFLLGFAANFLPEGINADGNSVFLDASRIKVQLAGGMIPIKIENLYVENGNVRLRLLLPENLYGSLFSGLFSEKPENGGMKVSLRV